MIYTRLLQQGIWIDAAAPTNKDFVSISNKTGVPIEILKEYFVNKSHSTTIVNRKNTIIILNSVADDRAIDLCPLVIFFTADAVITLHKRKIKALARLLKRTNSQKITHSNFFYLLCDETNEDYFDELESIENNIDVLESNVVSKKNHAGIKEIFQVKKYLTYIHKALVGNRDVISTIEKGSFPWMQNKELLLLREKSNDIISLIDIEETYREILTGILETYLTISSINLNKIITTLTVITAFALGPTVISSIYGMNFKYMPEFAWKWGYLWALFLMVASVGVMYYIFKKKEWI